MPETRATKRRKLEGTRQKDSKRKKSEKPTPTKKQSKKRKKTPEKQAQQRASEPVDEEEILKAFDLETKFGACIGISRLDRWKRAKRFRLNPPDVVRAILEKHGDEDSCQNCLWEGRV